MTIGTNFRTDATGNDATTTYPYTFKVFAATHLDVKVRATATGVETTLTYPTHYSVTGVGAAAGGNVVLADVDGAWQNAADGTLKSGYTITIRRIVPVSQSTDVRNQGAFFAEVHEDAFDYLAMIDQQQQDGINRAIKLPSTEAGSDASTLLPAAAQRANKYLSFDTSGNPQVTAAASASGTTVTIPGGTSGILLANRFDARPEDYGAVGDGVTDDATAINAALAAHKYVRFTPGKTYLIGSHMIPQSGSWIDARGANIKLKNAANAHLFRIPTLVNDVTVEGGDWNGNKANQTTGGNGFTNETAGTVLRVRLINLTVHDCFSHNIGWNATTTKYVIEMGVISYNAGASNIGCIDSLNLAAVVGNVAYNAGTSNFGGSGTHHHVTYVGNVGEGAGTADNFTGYGSATEHVACVGNVSKGGTNHGIHFGGSFTAVVGNVVDAPSQYGIVSVADVGNTTGAVVVGNAVDASAKSGIWLDKTVKFAVVGNSVVAPNDHGVYINGADQYGAIVGNSAYGSVTVDGIRTEGTCLDLAIVGNVSAGNASDGAQIANTTASIIVGNRFTGNAAGFNETGTSDGNVIAANSATGNTGNTPTFAADADVVTGNLFGGTNALASAAALTLPDYTDYIVVTGTTGITSITARPARTHVTLRFDDALTVTDGGNLFLAGNFTTTSNDTLSLVCDGTNWYETGRSVN